MDAKRALEDAAIWVDGDGWRVLSAVGKDRATWLNGLVTCDLKDLAPGGAAYGLLLEKKGKINAELIVVATADRLLVAIPDATCDATYDVLDHHLIMEDVDLSRSELRTAFLHGPRATAIAGELGVPWAPLDRTGLGGAVLIGDAGALAAAREKGLAVPVDASAWERLRVERVVPSWGVDFDASHYPQEASLAKVAVSFSKGCYLGQEVAYMLENRGQAKRHLVRLRLEGDGPVERGAEVKTPAGEVIGQVSSAATGLLETGVFALAMVKRALAAPGTALTVSGRGATVAPVGRG